MIHKIYLGREQSNCYPSPEEINPFLLRSIQLSVASEKVETILPLFDVLNYQYGGVASYVKGQCRFEDLKIGVIEVNFRNRPKK